MKLWSSTSSKGTTQTVFIKVLWCIKQPGKEEEMFEEMLKLPGHAHFPTLMWGFSFFRCDSIICDFRIMDVLLRIYKQEILITTMMQRQIFSLFAVMVD